MMNDDSQKMQVIQQLMDELQEMMKPSADDLGERLGRPKQVDVMAIKAGPGMNDPSMGGHPMDDSDPDDDSMGPDDDDMSSSDPDEMLKKRLMKLRE